MSNVQVWLKRCLCWVFIFTIVFSMPFSFAEVNDEAVDLPEEIVVDITPEPTPVPTEEPTPVPTEESTPVPTEVPTPIPTEEPTAVPTEESTTIPTQEPTSAPTEDPAAVPTEEPIAVPEQELETPAPTTVPATEESAEEATLAPETPEPPEVPTPEPSEEPEPVPYTGYAKLTERSRVYKTENTSTVEYRLPADTIVYVDGIVLENVERVYVNYSVDSKKTGGYVELTVVSGMPPQDQDDIKLELEKIGNLVYYDAQKQVPLPAVIPEYPVSATLGASVASATVVMTEKADISLSQAEKNAILLKGMKSGTNTLYICTSVADLQSLHPYGNSRNELYIYQQTGATNITLTFSSDTYIENNYDLIGIFDANDQLVGNVAYTGSGLAGRTITVAGDTVQILLMTDYSVTKYGFRVTNLSATTTSSSLAIAAVNATSARLSWRASGLISGYYIYRATSANGTYTYLGQTTGASYTASAPAGAVSYYKIRGYILINGTKYLSAYSVYRAIYPLATPTIKSVTKASSTQLKVQWNAIANASKYQLYHSTSQNGTYTKIKELTGTSVTLTLNNKQGHYFKVRAVKTVGSATYYGSFSAIKVGIFGIGKVSLPTPYVESTSRVRLTWAAVAGAAGYQISRKISSTGAYKVIANTTKLTYTDSSCKGGQYYYYRVRAYIGSGSSRTYGAFSAVRGVYTLSHPKSPTISLSGNKVTLKWNKVANASRYCIYTSTSANGTYTKLGTTAGLSYTTTYTSGLYYRVRAYRTTSAGNNYFGPYSAAKTVGSKYRALLISNGYSGNNTLTGTANDSAGMQRMLGRMAKTPYAVTRKTNLTAAQMLSQISSAFSGATTNDVSLFFFSGHGDRDGSIIGNNSVKVTPSQLRAKLDTIPGKKIVLIDSCHSGAMIGKSAEDVAAAKAVNDAFVNAFISEFAKADRNLAASNYYVITAAHSTQYSAESTINGTRAGFFTYALCQGAGWDYTRGSNTSFPADTNGDRKLSLHEIYTYTYTYARQLNPGQSAQVYPTNSSFTLFGY